MMVGRSDKSVRSWRSQFCANDGELPENKKGKYQWTGILWSSEDFNTARMWLHELGFEVVVKKKGPFVDGHEWEDVVQYRNKFF